MRTLARDLAPDRSNQSISWGTAMHAPRSANLLPYVILTVLGFAGELMGATINVPGDQSTIQAALSAASSGDTVLVAPGTYFEHDLSFGGKDIVLQSSGGAASTIIDGNGLGPVFQLHGTLSRAAVIEGFTIQNGSGSSFRGGGISIAFGSPTIRNNIIADNTTDDGGGGIKAKEGSNPLIVSNQILRNSAQNKGGGIQVVSATAEVKFNTISQNTAVATATSSGGGINVTAASSKVDIHDNTIELNSSTFSGGGISILKSTVDVLRNQVSQNTSEFGGGIHLESNDLIVTWTISDNSFTDNVATRHGGGINLFAAEINVTASITGNLLSDNDSVNASCESSPSDCGQGGGIRASQGTGQETFQNNTIQNNSADHYGGALFLGNVSQGKTVIFKNNTVEANTALFDYPGVGCNGVATCIASDSSFISNGPDVAAPTPNTGGLFIRNVPSSTIENNYFRGNVGRLAGALLLSTSGTTMFSTVKNNTFADNVTTSSVDGSLRTNVDADIVNNVFEGDIRGISAKLSPSVTVNNNSFNGYSLGVFRTETVLHASAASLNGESFASANLDVPPGFIDPNDVHLDSSSLLLSAAPCGQAPAADIDGDLRPIGAGCEIGADEYNPDWLEIFADGFESGNTNSWSLTDF